MNALATNVRPLSRPSVFGADEQTAEPRTDPHYAIGASYSHIDWAEAALRAGEPDRALAYLLLAKAALEASCPTLEGHADRYFISGLSA